MANEAWNSLDDIVKDSRDTFVETKLCEDENTCTKLTGGKRTVLVCDRGTTKDVTEFSPTGKLLRKTVHNNLGHTTISEGINMYPDGSQRIEKEILYINGEPYSYKKNVWKYDDGSQRVDKQWFFAKDKPLCYKEGYQVSPSGDTKTDKCIFFKNGKLLSYRSGVKTSPDNSCSSTKCVLGFDINSIPNVYKRNSQILKDGVKKNDIVFVRKSGNWADLSSSEV